MDVHPLLLGWPDTPLGEEFKLYQSRINELSVLNGCVLWGSRVVIPPQGRKAVLEDYMRHTLVLVE